MNSARSPLVKKVRKKTVFSNPVKFPPSVTKGLFFFILLWGITACQSAPVGEKQSDRTSDVVRSETKFTLNNAILEQSNTQGNIVWKVKSNKTTYSQDRQTAKLEQVTANLIEDGKVILQLSSKQGEIRQNGSIILLQDQILVTDPRNQAVVRSEEAEWRPSEHILIVRKGIKGVGENLEVEADGGKYSIDKQRLELSGNVVGTTLEPSLQLKTDHLTWLIPQQKAIGDRPLKVVRYQNNTITDRVVANRGEVDLQQHILSLQQEVEMRSLAPALQIATNSVKWNYQTRVVTSEQPIQIIDLDNKLDIIGNKGTIDLNRQIANLDDGIEGIDNRNQSQLYARQLTWYIPTEQVEATGNVIYQQADPPLKLTGDKAIGKLKNNSVVVTNNNRQNRVVTEIVP
ncbi:MAG: LPS export ABC transporter periplasmic protein LptC [Xenococcaceae cyanobacterium MO_188.B32]|nr:LPS export ABC transporter periplasmic protein LptC [Xenococcaceae cyanobacterium MO_188.B32]